MYKNKIRILLSCFDPLTSYLPIYFRTNLSNCPTPGPSKLQAPDDKLGIQTQNGPVMG